MRLPVESIDENESEALVMVKELISDIFVVTGESSYKDPKTARELRKASVNAVYAILNGCKSMLRGSMQREFNKANKFLADMKWYMCVTLENGGISRGSFYDFMKKIRDIESMLVSVTVPKKNLENCG